MRKVLVTGATGFIGTHLVPALIAAGYEPITVNSKDGDVTVPGTWERFPAADLVVHLAGKSFVPDSWNDPAGFIGCNLASTTAALDYCRKHKAKLIFLSSYLYGNPERLPISEDSPLIALNPYALSKKLSEDACRFYAASFGVPVIILRPFNVYGPGQNSSFLLPAILRQIMAGESVQVNDLEPKRDYIYIADLVDAILKSLSCDKPIEVFNIGSGASYSVADVIGMIQSIYDTRLPVHSQNTRRKDEIMDTVADISHASEILDWSPRWTLQAGLKETAAQFKNQ